MDNVPVTVIRPPSGWIGISLRELWSSRELAYFLAWRDVKVRYKQTALGVAWAVLQPLVAAAIFSFFLGRLVHIPSEGVPYGVFALAGLLPWTFFANAVASASGSIVNNANLVTKTYCPRIILPLASVTASAFDLLIGLIPLFIFMFAGGVRISAAAVALPVVFVLLFITALAVSIGLAALNVRYRDVRYAVPFLLQVWMFATPVVYPASLAPSTYRPFLGLNPMAGVVEAFRWSALGTPESPWPLFATSAAVVMVVLYLALAYFSRVEHTFADVI